MVNALLSQLFLECVAGLNDRKGCIFTNDMKLTRQNMKYFVYLYAPGSKRVTQFQFSVCMYGTCGRIDNKADFDLHRAHLGRYQ